MRYIIAAHGNYAIEAKKSCQMITGQTEHITAIAFTEEMGIEDVVSAYKSAIEDCEEENIIIMVDIVGGTPCNAALILAQTEDIQVIAGLSLSMLIMASLGENIDSIILESKNAVQLVKAPKWSDVELSEEGEEEE